VQLISLSRYVDFLMKTGAARATEVKSHQKEPFDLYAALKAHVEATLERGLPLDALDHVVTQVSDPRRQRLYPPLVAGLRKFLGKLPAYRWIRPPAVNYPIAAGFALRVNPELGLEVDGARHLIKLHCRRERLTARRAQLVVACLRLALPPPKGALWTYGVLDVAAAKLHGVGAEATLERAIEVVRADAQAYAMLARTG